MIDDLMIGAFDDVFPMNVSAVVDGDGVRGDVNCPSLFHEKVFHRLYEFDAVVLTCVDANVHNDRQDDDLIEIPSN